MTYFATGAFRCFQESAERAVTYRTNLLAPNGSIDFAEKISLWLSSGPSVQVAGVLLSLDSMCNLSISSFGDPECGEGTEQEATTETPMLPATAQSNELHTIIVTDATTTDISINRFIEFRMFGIGDCYDWVVSIYRYLSIS